MNHDFTTHIAWTGNRGGGTRTYRGYDRTWDIVMDSAGEGSGIVCCSNDPLLGGDPVKLNPESLLLCSLAACHMLWYLHLAGNAGIVVIDYRDTPLGRGEALKSGAGRFVSAVLRPAIAVAAGSDLDLARSIHGQVHEYCFIARSVNFPVSCGPSFTVAGDGFTSPS